MSTEHAAWVSTDSETLPNQLAAAETTAARRRLVELVARARAAFATATVTISKADRPTESSTPRASDAQISS